MPSLSHEAPGTAFGDRLYLASQWMGPESESDPGPYVAVNFSGDGANWSGWRVPASTLKFEPASAPAVAANGNHVYVLAPVLGAGAGTKAPVWAY